LLYDDDDDDDDDDDNNNNNNNNNNNAAYAYHNIVDADHWWMPRDFMAWSANRLQAE